VLHAVVMVEDKNFRIAFLSGIGLIDAKNAVLNAKNTHVGALAGLPGAVAMTRESLLRASDLLPGSPSRCCASYARGSRRRSGRDAC